MSPEGLSAVAKGVPENTPGDSLQSFPEHEPRHDLQDTPPAPWEGEGVDKPGPLLGEDEVPTDLGDGDGPDGPLLMGKDLPAPPEREPRGGIDSPPENIYDGPTDMPVGQSPDMTDENSDAGAQRETNEDHPEAPENTDGVQEDELQELKEEYIDDIIENSEFPETIDEEKAKSSEYEKCSVEETAEKRVEFNKNKDTLIKEWEEKTGQKWPTYKEDVYSSNGSLIRRAGDKYDAHHIQPLSMGGKNEADNITPLHAERHYDRQGVHAPDSAYSKLEQKLGA